MGRYLARGALVYAFGGEMMQTRVATSWLQGPRDARRLFRDDRLIGTRFNASAELSATDRLFVRLD